MKKSIKKALVGVSAVSHMAVAVGAQMSNLELAKLDICDKYEILHINGIMTDLDGARANVLELTKRFGNSHNQHVMRYGLAFNASDNFVADIAQSAQQLMTEYPGSSFREWMNYIMNAVWPQSQIGKAASEAYGTIAELVANVRRPAAYWTTDPDMPRMMNEIAQFHRGGRIAFVGHSQGTIYANIIYNLLTGAGYTWASSPTTPAFKIPSTRLGLVSVAAVVTSIPGGTRITSSNDAVVDAVRKIVPLTLGPTHTLVYYPNIDPYGHNFRDTYLAQAAGTVVAAIGSKLDTLKPQFNDLSSYNGGSAMIWGWSAWYKCQPYAPCSDGRTTGEEVAYSKSPTTVYGYGPMSISNLPVRRPGSYGEILGLANSFAATCYSTLVNNRIKRVTAGGAAWDAPNIPGCSSYYDYGSRESYAWMLYSSDAVSIRPVPNSIAPESYGSAEARVYAYPVCKP